MTKRKRRRNGAAEPATEPAQPETSQGLPDPVEGHPSQEHAFALLDRLHSDMSSLIFASMGELGVGFPGGVSSAISPAVAVYGSSPDYVPRTCEKSLPQ
jgi:hypothetical protein